MQGSQNLGTNWKGRFFAIWGGQKLSWIGSSLSTFALIWWLTERTGSATVLAMGTLLSMLPTILFGPFIGALVDRWNRRWVMLVADSAIALVSLWLAYLFWSDALQIWHAYVVMFARGVGSAFHDPAIHAATAIFVPREHLPRVQGLNSALMGAVSVVSPPLGALLIGWLPLHAIMGLVGVGVGALIVGFAPPAAFGLGLAGMLVVGVMLALTDGPLMALLQTIVPQDKQGRVFAVVMSAANLATPVGMAIGGPVSDRFGGYVLFVLSGVTCIATAIVAFLTPPVMQMEEHHAESELQPTLPVPVDLGVD